MYQLTRNCMNFYEVVRELIIIDIDKANDGGKSPLVPNISCKDSRELVVDLSILAVPFVFSSGLSVTVIVMYTNETGI